MKKNITPMLMLIIISIMVSNAEEIIVAKSKKIFSRALNEETPIEIYKVYDKKTKEIKFASNNENIQSIEDLEKLTRKEEALKEKKRGKLGKNLWKEFINLDYYKDVHVRVILKRPRVKHLDKTKHSAKEMKMHSKHISKLRPYASMDQYIKKNRIKNVKKRDKYYLECDMKKFKIISLMFDEKVAGIEKVFKKKPVAERQFRELSLSAMNPPIIPYYGEDIGAATFENGIMQSMFDCINDNPVMSGVSLDIDLVDISSNTDWHAQHCFNCLYYTAPLANLSHVADQDYASEYSQDAIKNRAIRTASQSLSNEYDPNTFEFLVMDNWAYEWPYPVFCNPTANNPDEIVNWGNYNSISVGNVQHYDLTTYRHLPSHLPDDEVLTQWINPPAIYGGSDDRELPHLLAPGYHPDHLEDYWIDVCGQRHKWGCGTSYSAPTVNGIAASVMSADSRMVSWPEKVRVALMLTAQNLHGGYWDKNSDGQDGNGVISGDAAVKFAIDHTSVSPNNSAVETGLCGDAWYNTETSSKYFYVKAPQTLPSDKHLRIVLTWDSNPDLNARVNYLSDLDLYFNNNQYNCTSWNSNVEIIDVPNSSLTPGSTYEIQVDPYTFRMPSGDSFFYYSIGWTWVKNSAN